MSDKTEYFNAKFAGDYLGDQWVVRGADFDKVERQKTELVEALRYMLDEALDDYFEAADPDGEIAKARTFLAALEAEKGGE